MDTNALEEQSIVQSVIDVLEPTLKNEDDVGIFLSVLRDVFPVSLKSKSSSGPFADIKLVNAVRDQLNEDNMKETQDVMDKVCLCSLIEILIFSFYHVISTPKSNI